MQPTNAIQALSSFKSTGIGGVCGREMGKLQAFFFFFLRGAGIKQLFPEVACEFLSSLFGPCFAAQRYDPNEQKLRNIGVSDSEAPERF